MAKPNQVRVRMYQVGFGDCFLLSFDYTPKASRHVLIDCGSMAYPKGSPSGLIKRVAKHIAATVGDDPFAVVATHRHADHISGFDPGANGKGPGAIIAGLNPRFVVQPWTEDPDLAVDAEGPPLRGGMALRQQTLDSLNMIAEELVRQYVPRLKRRRASSSIARQVDFIGQDNIKNGRAVKNLMNMAPNDYVYAGRTTRLTRFLPGVRVHVLGPPTVQQHAAVRQQRASDTDEFWHLQMRSLNMGSTVGRTESDMLFKDHPSTPGRNAPIAARWLVNALKEENAEQLLQLVRMLDDAMNNTSLILLFECGKEKLLFPGDAQIENWQYALSKDSLSKHVDKVSVYKVGHHGSLNATPKTLWKRWFPDGASATSNAEPARQMVALLSTLEGKHGSADNQSEVPRRKLVRALKDNTTLRSTENLGESPHHDEFIEIG
jgi:hypothetical protein